MRRRPLSGATAVLPSITDEGGKALNAKNQSYAATVWRCLESTGREKLAYSELEELCERRLGLDARAAAEATAELHRSGHLVHFAGTTAANTVFLMPELSSEIVATALAPAGVDEATSHRLFMRLKEIDVRYRPLKQQRDMVVRDANRKTTRRLWGYFWAVAGQNVVFIYLIYSGSSWDLMEPVTYFYSQALIMFWWTYFIFNSREMNHTSWRQSYVDMYAERGMKSIGWTDETAETYRHLSEMRKLCVEKIDAQVSGSMRCHMPNAGACTQFGC